MKKSLSISRYNKNSSGSGLIKENSSPIYTPFIQPKLTTGQLNDSYEQEANSVAKQVMRMPQQNFIQNKYVSSDHINRKPLSQTITPFIQIKSDTTNHVSNSISQSIHSSRGKGNSIDNATQSFMSSRFGNDFSKVKIHTDGEAIQLNRNLNAKAFTVGSDIYFNQGQYQPNSAGGKQLLAHELAHVVQQQNINASIQRQPVDMPPMKISVGMPSDLSSLSTPPAPGSVTMSRDPAQVALNSQLATTLLPFTGSGWDGNVIANKLGQYDQIPGTDSDAVRCVQSVALMSHILMGPSAACSYLSSISLQGMLMAAKFGTRQRTALRVIDFVRSQVINKKATYGDMYWAMEAVHDLFYADEGGTPAASADSVREQITPMPDLSQNMVNVDVWCSDRSELLSQAASLNPGEQFMLNTWSASFNSVFDEAGVPTTQQRLTYTQTDEKDRPLRTVSIKRIDTSKKPKPDKIDLNRDHKHGHQMLVFKDVTTKHIKLYEPELTIGGSHLFDLTDDPSLIDSMLFFDQPQFELFEYIQLWGKMVPSSLMSPIKI